jgi:hypothetical protein
LKEGRGGIGGRDDVHNTEFLFLVQGPDLQCMLGRGFAEAELEFKGSSWF